MLGSDGSHISTNFQETLPISLYSLILLWYIAAVEKSLPAAKRSFLVHRCDMLRFHKHTCPRGHPGRKSYMFNDITLQNMVIPEGHCTERELSMMFLRVDSPTRSTVRKRRSD